MADVTITGTFRRYTVTGAGLMPAGAARRNFTPTNAVAEFDANGAFTHLWIGGPQVRMDGTHGIRHTGRAFGPGHLDGLPEWARPLIADITPPPA